MKNYLVLAVAVLAVLVAVPAFAEDGRVSQSTLSALGLGGMQEMSDAEGLQIRGRQTGNGMVVGTSTISGQLVTPDTLNFITFSSISHTTGDFMDQTMGLVVVDNAHTVAINPAIVLDVTFPDTTQFIGSAIGQIGGLGNIQLLLP